MPFADAIRRALRRVLGRFEPADPVVREWEWYARDYRRTRPGEAERLGAEWNDPASIGVDVEADAVVSHLDERLFAPFLGTVEVLLEIGAGGGRFTAVLLPKTRRLIAADASPTMLELLRGRFADEPNVETLLLDGRTLRPLADDSVDAVFSYDVFVHLDAWTIFGYLEETRRVLRPGGKAAIHHANAFSELGWKKFRKDADRAAGGLPPLGAFPLLTPESFAELARRAGLSVERTITDLVRRDAITLLRAPEKAPRREEKR